MTTLCVSITDFSCQLKLVSKCIVDGPCLLHVLSYVTVLKQGHRISHVTDMTAVNIVEASQPGDAIYLEGQSPGTAFPKTLKSDLWKKIAAELQVDSHTACFAKQRLVSQRGGVQVASDMPDGAGIH